ncbi:glycosyltransferase family 9 protein [Maridesulfovibrio sp.]|uniref:glycosyltransferase family 9 protein n=1 Tax=Maridesulfovibrio sp. TaxID=2795000 RepID=UPI002A18E461|nr:glycosyltransferase family 9 protein [Maridesulfovibrio sp.]
MEKLVLSGSGGKWLLFSNGVLGHTLYVLAAVKKLKEIYPDAFVTMVVDKGSAELVRANPLIDKVSIFDRKLDPLARQWELIREWRREKYDVSIHFRSGVRNELLAMLSGVKMRSGNNLKGSFQFLNRIFQDKKGVHVLENRSFFMSNVLGREVALSEPELHHDPEARKEVAASLKECGIEPGSYVVLHPAGKTSGGLKWSLEHWAGVAAKVAASRPVVVVCAPFEREKVREAISGQNIFHLEGSTAFLSELIAGCGWFMGNDSSPGHMAAIWQKPRVVVYSNGPDEFIKWSPLYPEQCRVVLKEEFVADGLDESLEWLFSM